MKLFATYRRLLLALLPVWLLVVSAAGQTGLTVKEGDIFNLSVVQQPGDTYYWKVWTDWNAQIEAKNSEADFLSGNEGASVPVLWRKAGEYFFSVTAFNSNGCMNLKVGKIKVEEGRLKVVAALDAIVGRCNIVTLDASKSQGQDLTYFWDADPLPPGLIIENPSDSITRMYLSDAYTGPLPFSFRVFVAVQDTITKERSVAYGTIQFNDMPKAVAEQHGRTVSNTETRLDGTLSTGTQLSYLWSTTDGRITSSPNNAVITISRIGHYTLTVMDKFGCESSVTIEVTSLDDPNFVTITAEDDYARTSWVEEVQITVLRNDHSSDLALDISSLIPEIMQAPRMGDAIVNNSNGTISYVPKVRLSGRDNFTYRICHPLFPAGTPNAVCDTAVVTIDLYDGPIWVPEAISPNGDSENDIFEIRGLDEYKNSEISIYTRSGQLVYHSDDYQNDWDGRTLGSRIPDGTLVPTGTYYYVLHLGGTNRYLKGFVYVAY